MAALTQITLDADGTIAANVRHDAGTGSPFYTHCNDAPDGVSADYVENDDAELSTTAWFSLADVDADFGSMDSLNIDVDVEATTFSNDTCTLTARIYDADNDTTNALTNESGNLATHADSSRTQRNVSFAGLTGSKAQWNAAHVRFTWTYNKVSGPDNANLRLYGMDIDGIYTIESVTKATGILFSVQSPMGISKQPYGSFAGKVAAGGGGRIMGGLIGPSGLVGGAGGLIG